jgi:hypothetical protein
MKTMHSLLRQTAEIAFQKTQMQSNSQERVLNEHDENMRIRDEKTSRLKALRLAQDIATPLSKSKKTKVKS